MATTTTTTTNTTTAIPKPLESGAGTIVTKAITSMMFANDDHAGKLWRSRLGSGLRTALACFLVGCTTIYTPAVIRRQVVFPAFSYVTAILIVGEATVGDSLRGAAHAFYGTLLAMLPAFLCLMLIGARSFSVATTTLAVALSSFMVMLPESTPLVSRRIALGQIVLVYVEAFKQGTGDRAVLLHPGHAAASTAVGVVAGVLSVLLPYPRIACLEIRQKREEFGGITRERLRLLLDAFCAGDRDQALASISKARHLSKAGNKLLHSIRIKQESIQWERPRMNFSPNQQKTPFERLQAIDTSLKGMEIALSTNPCFPIKMFGQEGLADHLHCMKDQICLMLKDEKGQMDGKDIQNTTALPLDTNHLGCQDAPSLFFLFSMRLLHNQTMAATLTSSTHEKKVTPMAEPTSNLHVQEVEIATTRKVPRACTISISMEMFMAALKGSISMGLAVLFGILFSKDNGYWSGLTVAVSFTPWREATFKLANLRAQGTALGSAYGVLGSLISQDLMQLRFLLLLPWILFTSFLRRSRMYGNAGAVVAAVSAIILLGRRNYGPPKIFAIDRLIETFIGLLCSILVEVVLQPTRASSLAKSRLRWSIESLGESLSAVISAVTDEKLTPMRVAEIKEKGKGVLRQAHELRKFIVDAEAEPNFWFLPFPSASYNKLHGCLGKMAELVIFLGHSLEILVQVSHSKGDGWGEIQGAIQGNIELLKLCNTSIKCFEDVVKMKSLAILEKELHRRTISDDIEEGKLPNLDGVESVSVDEEKCEKIAASVLHHAGELIKKGENEIECEGLNSQLAVALGTFVFCIQGLIKETREMETGVMELIQLENPSKQINLHEISCKARKVQVL